MGPMRAAYRFVHELAADQPLETVTQIFVDLYGSLALTGRGHGTDRAILLGLSGETPDRVDPDQVDRMVQRIREAQTLSLDGKHAITFREDEHLRFRVDKSLAFHSNGIRFTALDAGGTRLARKVYFSVGGGFIVAENEIEQLADAPQRLRVPYPFSSAAELLKQGDAAHKRIPEMMRINELALRSPDQVRTGLLERWQIMNECIDRGLRNEGILPGGLNVRRRAKGLHQALLAKRAQQESNPTETLDWVNLYAIAVNEENAAGGRVVTAPTNGAAGIIPQYANIESTRTPTKTASSRSCSPPRRSAACANATPRSPAPRSDARARSASPARWQRPAWPRRLAAAMRRSRTPLKSASSTTSA